MLRQPRHPLRITLLLGLVLITTVLNLVRLLTAIGWRSALGRYMPSEELLYTGVTGALWMLVGVFVLWSYWRGGRLTRLIFLAAAGLYAAWFWADRLIVEATPQPNWLFAFAATILLLGFTAFVVLDPRNLPYFRKETYERKRENQPTT